MKTIMNYTGTFIAAGFLALTCLSCNNNAGSNKGTKDSVNRVNTKKEASSKPPSSFADTLVINTPAAVFYQPDSLQLSRIKAITDSVTFDGSMHENFYQMRNARLVIKKNWPGVQIIEAVKYRYLVFVKKDKTVDYINLDTRHETHGLFLFDAVKAPEPVDMTNIESFMGFYFSNQ